MPYRLGNLCGLVAPLLWASAIVLCGTLRPGFSHWSQYISELGERGSTTELLMRYAGLVPTGLMHVGFAVFLYGSFKNSRFAALAAALIGVNGLARIAAGMFSCETGCNGTGLEQQLHGLSATIGFFAFIGAAVLWGFVFRHHPRLRNLGLYTFFSAILALVFLLLMSWTDPTRAGTGLYERLSSGLLSLWLFVFAARLWGADARNPAATPRAARSRPRGG